MPPAVFHGSATYPASGPAPVVTIGNFDGVHQGHQALIRRAVALANRLRDSDPGVQAPPVCVLTFHPAPRDVLRPGNPVPRIQSLEDRIACLGDAGVDHVVVEPFTKELAAESARAFFDVILVRRLRAAGLVLGWDFRFGRGREGTVDHLRDWMAGPVEQVEALTLGGPPDDDAPLVVSSSRIRQLVQAGQVEEAAVLLGRPHRLRGTVGRGDQRGRALGFPTANVAVQTSLTPPPGVYAVRIEIDGALHPGVANLGTRPTFGGGEQVLEVHVLDFQGDLYDAAVAVDLVARIRDEQRFEGIEALVARIGEDVAAARARLG